MRSIPFFVSVCCASILAAGIAGAQTDPGDSDYARAAQLRSAQQYANALAIYQRLSEQTHSPRALAQMGVTEAQMGRWVAAEEHLAAALATDDRWVRHHRDTLQDALEATRQHLGSLTVACNVPGAELLVNSAPVGTLPRAAVRILRGTVVVDVRAEGYEPHRETLQVATNATQVEVTLVRRAEVAPRPVEPVIAPVASTTPIRVAPVATPPEVPGPRRVTGGGLPRTLAWVAGGGAVAGFGLALIAWRLREGAVGDYNGGCPVGEADEMTVSRCAMARMTADGDRGTWETVTTVGLVTGAALAVGTVVLFATAPTEHGATRTSMRCGPGPGLVGAQCGVNF